MVVHYRPVTLDDFQQVRELLEACGIEREQSEESRLRRMIDYADRTVGAFDDGMVGFASALCDEAFSGYVGAICVHPEHRGQGIGTELVTQLTEDSPEITWVVRAMQDSHGFWQRLGFTPSGSCMERLGEG